MLIVTQLDDRANRVWLVLRQRYHLLWYTSNASGLRLSFFFFFFLGGYSFYSFSFF